MTERPVLETGPKHPITVKPTDGRVTVRINGQQVAVTDALTLLLIHKIDSDCWAMPSGGMDLGESIADAAVREVREETGLVVRLAGLVGI